MQQPQPLPQQFMSFKMQSLRTMLSTSSPLLRLPEEGSRRSPLLRLSEEGSRRR